MKLQNLILYPALLLLFVIPGFTQDEKQQMLVLSGGISAMARQDLVYSPFRHADLSLQSFGLKYRKSKKLFQYIETGFSANKSLVGDPSEMNMGDHTHMIMPHEFLNIHLSYGIGTTVEKTAKYKAWVGGSLKTDVQAAFYQFTLSEMFGYFISQSAHIWYRRNYSFAGKHNLSFHAEMPVLTWLARPPYLAEDDEFIENIISHRRGKILLAFAADGKWATWNKLQRLNLNMEYMHPVSNRLNIGADYRFSFIHSSKPKTLLSYQHQLHITGAIKF